VGTRAQEWGQGHRSGDNGIGVGRTVQ